MELQIRHTTHYRYEDSVDLAQHVVHLTPRDHAGQSVHKHRLCITPEPRSQHSDHDHFGNARTFFSHQSPHDELLVQADSVVSTHAPRALPSEALIPRWEAVREHLRYRAHAPFDAASEYLFASPHVPRDDAFIAFARPAMGPARGWVDAVCEIGRAHV